MLRKFVQCANVNERLAMVSGENVEAWSSEELDAAMKIVGATADANTNEAKLQAIMKALEKNASEALSDAFVSRARELTDSIPAAEEISDVDYSEVLRELCHTAAAQQMAFRR